MKKIIFVLLVLLLAMPMAFATDKEVTITLPDFDVLLNGTKVDNKTEPYPFIHYKGITYIPMTWDLSNALGLKLKWDSELGLTISKASDMTVYEQKKKVINDTDGEYQAKVVSFPVTVNGKVINNTEETYPLLNFRNITYFPMTWKFMVTEFSSGYVWNKEIGLSVSADKKLSVHIPEPYKVTLSTSMSELNEKGVIAKEMLLVKADKNDSDTSMDIQILAGFNHLFHGYLADVDVDLYDKDGDFLYKVILYQSTPYVSMLEGYNPDLNFGFSSLLQYENFVVNVTLTPPSVARAIYEKEPKVAIEWMDNQVDLEQYKKEGAQYIKTYFIPHTINFADRDLIPYIAMSRKGNYYKDGEYKFVTTSPGGIINFYPANENSFELNTINKMYIDQTKPYNDLILALNDSVMYEGYSGFIYLYNRDYELIKIIINEFKIESFK